MKAVGAMQIVRIDYFNYNVNNSRNNDYHNIINDDNSNSTFYVSRARHKSDWRL